MKQESPTTLSIIVPAYNAAGFLESCLRSILSQMESRHALIVIDDGSRDGTHEVAERLRAAYPQADVTLLRQPNMGIAATRNRALEVAGGDYILFVDADDLLAPGALAALDGVIAQHGPDVIACDFKFWRPDNERKGRTVQLGYPPNALLRDREAMLATFFADRHTYVWANVFRREIYARAPQPVFPQGRVFEDLSVLPRLVAECASLYRLAQPTIEYRQHPASITKAVSARWCIDCVSALRQVKESLAGLATGDVVRMQIDVAACYFYIGIVKNSFQLPWGEGRTVRPQVRQLFLDSLFHQPSAVLAAMEGGTVLSHDRKGDIAAARQVRQALEDRLAFGLVKTVSRRIKMWQKKMAA